jgi:hypothetical protein
MRHGVPNLTLGCGYAALWLSQFCLTLSESVRQLRTWVRPLLMRIYSQNIPGLFSLIARE